MLCLLTCKNLRITHTLDYLLTGEKPSCYDSNVRNAREKNIPIINLDILKQVLLEEISVDEMIRLGLSRMNF